MDVCLSVLDNLVVVVVVWVSANSIDKKKPKDGRVTMGYENTFNFKDSLTT